MTEVLQRDFSRKTFLKGGGALVVGFAAAGALGGRARSADSPYASNGPPPADQVDSFLTIHADNTVTVDAGRVELGQGSIMGLMMLAAEELGVGIGQMRFARADTNVSPSTGNTTGSSSIRRAGPRVRAAAAYAKQALLGMAAKQLGVAAASLSVKDGVVSGGGKSITYGALVGDRLLNVTMPKETLDAGQAPAKPVAQYELVGKAVLPRVDIPEKVTGQHTYVHNIRVPNMLHARVVRPRGQGGYGSGLPIVSVDEGSIKHLGARVVRKNDFLAVVAEKEYAAIQGAAQLKVKWADPPPLASSGNMFKQMRDFDAAGQTPARYLVNTGNVDAALASAEVKLNGTYAYHYNGHLPIGPSCAIADVKPDAALVFTNTQGPYRARQILAETLGLPESKVRVVYYEGASSWGSAPYDDCAQAAAVVSQLTGRPVRMQFMRWDEHGWDNYGPALLADVRGGIDASGKIVAYEYTGFGIPGSARDDTTFTALGRPVPKPRLGGADTGNTGTQYELANRRVIAKSVPLLNTHFKTSPLRAPNAPQAVFASEQFVDELAHAARMDPVEFRRRNINEGDLNRWSDVLEAVAKLAGWQPRVAASSLSSANVVRGRGIALGGFAGSQAAVVAEIEVNRKTGKITAKELWAAEVAGLAVHLEGLDSQMVGCLSQGVSRALFESVSFDTKRVTSLDWVTYPMLRFRDAPKVHNVTVQRPDLQPTGSGEPGVVPVPAAIANAFFDATGVRIREAPMTPARVRAVLRAAGK